MSAITDHARSMIAYNHWANQKILQAASGLSADDFLTIRGTLVHTVGTQRYWRANWRGQEDGEPEGDLTQSDLKAIFEVSDADLDEYAASLTDEEWARTEAWWKRWGIDVEAPVGPMIFQVIYHGIQHRAEVATILTELGASPGDLDYLVFLQELTGAA